MLLNDFSIFSSGSHLFSRAKSFGNFVRGPYEEHLCEFLI